MHGRIRHIGIAVAACAAGHLLLYGGVLFFVVVAGDGTGRGDPWVKGMMSAESWFRFTAHTTVPITMLLLLVFVTLLARSRKPQVLTALWSLLLAILTPLLFLSTQFAVACITTQQCNVDFTYIGSATLIGSLLTWPSAIVACLVANVLLPAEGRPVETG